jgi:hypothetical protein
MKFYLNHQRYRECIGYCQKLADLNEAFETEQGMCRMMMAITLLQLKMGDVVQVANYLSLSYTKSIWPLSFHIGGQDIRSGALRELRIFKKPGERSDRKFSYGIQEL